MSTFPKFLLENEGVKTARQFRAKKRAQLKAIISAVGKYRIGCAYCPNYAHQRLDTIQQILNEMRTSHSKKAWK